MNTFLKPALSAMVGVALLSACNGKDTPVPIGDSDAAVAPPATPAPAAMPSASETLPVDSPALPGPTVVGGDGSQLVLSGLTATDLAQVTLQGELACSFTQGAGGPALLIARGDVADGDGRASFAVKIGDYVQQGTALEDGGYDGMLDGARFGTQGMTLTVRDVSDVPAQPGGESPPHGAELLAQRADGAERSFAGLWTCGP